MSGHPPRVSVVVPTYNRAATVGRALASLAAQTFGDFEVVVVDDGSTDGTGAVVAEVTDDRVRYRRTENAGVSSARNVGIGMARGRWVAFLDSDDEASPEWLAHTASLAGGDDVGVVCTGIRRVVEPSGEVVFLAPKPMGPVFDDVEALFLPGSFAVRRDLLEEVGGYADGLVGGENTELAMRLIPAMRARRLRLVADPAPLVTMYYDASVRAGGDKRFVRGAEYVLAQHAALLAKDPPLYADHLAIVGVGRAREGRYAEARGHFRAAIARDPWAWRRWARFGLACVPPLARRVWGAEG